MKTISVRSIHSGMEAEVSRLVREGASKDRLILAMRNSGLNKIDSMKLLRNHAGVNLAEAKDLVHRSRVWADRAEPDEAFHDSVITSMKAIGL